MKHNAYQLCVNPFSKHLRKKFYKKFCGYPKIIPEADQKCDAHTNSAVWFSKANMHDMDDTYQLILQCANTHC